jgi:hypothetical protein
MSDILNPTPTPAPAADPAAGAGVKPLPRGDYDGKPWLEAGFYRLVGVVMRHKGRQLKSGDVVELDEEQANRLSHVIVPADAPKAKPAAK